MQVYDAAFCLNRDIPLQYQEWESGLSVSQESLWSESDMLRIVISNKSVLPKLRTTPGPPKTGIDYRLGQSDAAVSGR